MSTSQYEPVVGLEIHVELATESKMFCGCPADWFGKEPNTQTCPTCLGLPGALPFPNKKAIESAIMIGLALNCSVNLVSKFDRKHYFYPDLPKGYQISQYDVPFSYDGYYEFTSHKTNAKKRVRIKRVHMEEDTGKLSHEGQNSLIDYNRSGVPLVEIVTEPDFNDSDEVKQFLEELQVIIRSLGVSDADMEKGSMRLEPNISARKNGNSELPNYKVEVKNINSFRFVKLAIDSELVRQTEMLERNETPAQETRGFHEPTSSTVSQRSKEEAHDYRYFPEPDIPPIHFTSEEIDVFRKALPELPHARLERYMEDYSLKYTDAYIITRSLAFAEYYEKALEVASQDPQMSKIEDYQLKIATLMINKKLPFAELSPEEFVSQASTLLMPKTTDMTSLNDAIKKVLAENPTTIDEIKAGKMNAIMFLFGQVMKELKGNADAAVIRKSLEEAIQNY